MNAVMLPPPDLVSRPPHYCKDPTGIECIHLTQRLPFCEGNAVKYVFRAGEKGAAEQDYRKAAWYLRCAADRLAGAGIFGRLWYRFMARRFIRHAVTIAYLDHPRKNMFVCCVLARIEQGTSQDLARCAAFLETHADWLHIYP